MNTNNIIERFFQIVKKIQIKWLYGKGDYLEAYRKHTDFRIEEDPKSAIGGKWDEIGLLQYRFLKDEGLKQSNRMLDIGCGTLRGGHHFIKYLEKGNYYGIDISPKAVDFANNFIKNNEDLYKKDPNIILNEQKNLKFKNFESIKFDFILAQSVFTHLKPEHIEECFTHIMNIMHSDTCFYFTYFKSDNYNQKNMKDFEYPYSFFENMANKYGYNIKDKTKKYPHPSDQNMLVINLKT